MITAAEQLKAIAYISGPKGTTLGKALEGRGSKGSINFNTGSDRAQLLPLCRGHARAGAAGHSRCRPAHEN